MLNGLYWRNIEWEYHVSDCRKTQSLVDLPITFWNGTCTINRGFMGTLYRCGFFLQCWITRRNLKHLDIHRQVLYLISNRSFSLGGFSIVSSFWDLNKKKTSQPSQASQALHAIFFRKVWNTRIALI